MKWIEILMFFLLPAFEFHGVTVAFAGSETIRDVTTLNVLFSLRRCRLRYAQAQIWSIDLWRKKTNAGINSKEVYS